MITLTEVPFHLKMEFDAQLATENGDEPLEPFLGRIVDGFFGCFRLDFRRLGLSIFSFLSRSIY